MPLTKYKRALQVTKYCLQVIWVSGASARNQEPLQQMQNDEQKKKVCWEEQLKYKERIWIKLRRTEGQSHRIACQKKRRRRTFSKMRIAIEWHGTTHAVELRRGSEWIKIVQTILKSLRAFGGVSSTAHKPSRWATENVITEWDKMTLS